MIRVGDNIGCVEFPCEDVRHENYLIPQIKVDPQKVSAILISEASPADPGDYYYTDGDPLFQQTTVQAFNDAGEEVSSVNDILNSGVYLTTAVKCGKTGYGIKSGTIKECSMILEEEIALFPNVKAFLLMGDVAIKAINYIAKRRGEERTIPPGSTYKIRGGEFYFQEKRAYPSYTQAGPSFFIEKSKRRMIAEDIASAMKWARTG